MDRFGDVGRAYHGRSALPAEVCHRLYRNERIRLTSDAVRVDRHAVRAARGVALRGDHRPAGAAGRHGRLRPALRRHPRGDRRGAPRRLAEARGAQGHRPVHLHAIRSWGRRCTSCARAGRSCSSSPTRCWDYTDVVMTLPARRRGARVPVVAELLRRGHHRRAPSRPSSPRGGRSSRSTPPPARTRCSARPRALERGKVYQGGNLPAFERMTGIGGRAVLYVGDHIYGDILRSRRRRRSGARA